MSPSECMPDVKDYTYMWWAHGWRRAKKVLCIQTGRYGLALEPRAAKLTHLGAIENAAPAGEALTQHNRVVLSLPKAELVLKVRAGGRWYQCAGSEAPASRIIESGRFVQRADVERLVFKDKAGRRLAAIGRLEIIAWPDRLAFMLEITPQKEFSKAAMAIELVLADGATLASERAAGGEAESWPAGRKQTVALCLGPPAGEGSTWRRIDGEPAAKRGRVEAKELKTGRPLRVTYDHRRGWHYVPLPAEAWKDNGRGDRIDRVKLNLFNDSDAPAAIRLLFAKDGRVPRITGLTPMLRDRDGKPTGIPVQLSKNWHRKSDEALLYQGPWLHAFSMVRLPARSSLECEFTLAHAYWGGVPAVSHAQLCLIGWGIDQLWDQVAIGSWGENICYDPDVNLNRSRIDDVRPLMVWGTAGPKAKWSWTQNVGGGDFLVYARGDRRDYLKRMRTYYRRIGPNLSEVTYAGVTPDGAVEMQATAMTPRCDDVTRAYYHLRCDVLKDTEPGRIELFRLGADDYNEAVANLVAFGSGAEMAEEWQPTGRAGYQRTVALPGGSPWVSLHKSVKVRREGATANRALVIRSWNARINGRNAPVPRAAIIGTGRYHNASVGILPASNKLKRGDFVECVIEMLIIPVRAGDYYGPNENLKAALVAGGDTWRPAARFAGAGKLDVKVASGKLIRACPMKIEVGPGGKAKFEVTGGLGYVPMTFTGLKDYKGCGLWMSAGGGERRVDQSVHGNDFWQTDHDAASGTWSRTYNVSLDVPGDKRRTVGFVLEKDRSP